VLKGTNGTFILLLLLLFAGWQQGPERRSQQPHRAGTDRLCPGIRPIRAQLSKQRLNLLALLLHSRCKGRGHVQSPAQDVQQPVGWPTQRAIFPEDVAVHVQDCAGLCRQNLGNLDMVWSAQVMIYHDVFNNQHFIIKYKKSS
jgi:hypothetical protein